MVCIAQERLQVGFLLSRERELEDGFEIRFDGVDLAVVFGSDSRVNLGRAARSSRAGSSQGTIAAGRLGPDREPASSVSCLTCPSIAWTRPVCVAGSVSLRICSVMMRSQVMRSIGGQSGRQRHGCGLRKGLGRGQPSRRSHRRAWRGSTIGARAVPSVLREP